jgi:hypothetical protein
VAELLKGAMMAINGIQFQKGLSLSAFIRDYGTEEQCEAAFIKARWPRGFVCPCCGGLRQLSWPVRVNYLGR